MTALPVTPQVTKRRDYLNADYRFRSWLLTTDHKRIAILYMIVDHAVFLSSAARRPCCFGLELMTPHGRSGDRRDLQQAVHAARRDHGVFLPDPLDSGGAGQFPVPLMIGARDLAFPKLNLASWYIFMAGGLVYAVGHRRRRRRHGLDFLHALQQHLCQHAT